MGSLCFQFFSGSGCQDAGLPWGEEGGLAKNCASFMCHLADADRLLFGSGSLGMIYGFPACPFGRCLSF